MSESYSEKSGRKMEGDTPLTKTNQSPKMVSRHRIPPVAYNENDVVMKDIQERMREKRQRRADLSRSRRGNITNASILLKLSLRANNRALAKALEEARCETRQDKATIFELQCALEAAQRELRQSDQAIQELKLEGQSLMELVTHFQESESKQRKRIYEVKKLLNEVTGKYLMNTVTLIDQAAGICNTPSLSKGSSFFVPKGSLSEDNFRDTLSIPTQDTEAMSRANIYYKRGCSSNSGEKTADANDDREETDMDTNDVFHPATTTGLCDNKSTTPNRLSVCGEESKRQSTASTRRSRATFYLDVNEMKQAVSTDVMTRCEEVEETKPASAPSSPDQSSPMEVLKIDHPSTGNSSILMSKGNTDLNKDLNGDMCLEKTDYKETEMELTHLDASYLKTNEETITGRQPSENVIVADDNEKIPAQQQPSSKEKKTKKVNIKKKKSSKGGKTFSKIPKALAGTKAAAAAKKKTAPESSVFDLSVGESFTKPVSPHHTQKGKTFQQNLSTESERSEPGENSSPLIDGKNIEVGEEDTGEDAGEDVGDLELCGKATDSNQPKTRRRSRQPHSKFPEKGASLQFAGPNVVIHKGLDSTVICSPFTGNEMTHRELKPLSQVLTESSHTLGDDLEGSFNALSRKPNFHKKMAKLKQKKKKLYDPKKSLDKEFTHAILNSQNERENRSDSKHGRQRKSSMVKSRQCSDAGGGDTAKGIANESLSGLLEESWMKDFLNDIDGESPDDYQRLTKSKGRGQQGRKTYRVSAIGKAEVREGTATDEMETAQHTRTVRGTDVGNERRSRPVKRRGTVCLKKKSEGLPEDKVLEGMTEEDGACQEERDEDDTGAPRSPSTRSQRANPCEYLTDIEEKNSNEMCTELKAVRRGTFDVRSGDNEDEETKDDVDEEKNEMEVRLEEGKLQNNGKKSDAKRNKRKSDEVSEDLNVSSGHARKGSSKRLKTKDSVVDDILEEDELDTIKVEVTKKTSKKSSSSSAGKKEEKKKTTTKKSNRGAKKSLKEKVKPEQNESSETLMENLVVEHNVVDKEESDEAYKKEAAVAAVDLTSEETEHREETKTNRKEKRRNTNKEGGRATKKQSLQTSARKSHVTFREDIEQNEKENLCTAIDESEGKALVITEEDLPANKVEVMVENGRRPSRQARTKAAKNLKEPSLGRKLRRGDPFTDVKLLTSPLVKCKKAKRPSKVINEDDATPSTRTALGDSTNVI